MIPPSTSGGGGTYMVGIGSDSPPPPAPSNHHNHHSSSSSGVIVQVGPGSNSSTRSNSAISTPTTSLLTSPATTPPTPAPSSSTSTTFQNIFGALQQQPPTPSSPPSFLPAAFSSNVTLTSNHVRCGSQDAAFVPNSPSTNITLPVIPSGNLGLAPLAILSSPSLGSTPATSPFAGSSPISPTAGIVSIDVAAATSSSQQQQLQTTFTSSSASSQSHMNSNAISPTTCSLNQSIAAGGIIGISSSLPKNQAPQPPQHCLLVSCNPPSLISSETQNGDNGENNQVTCTTTAATATSTTTTISIAPPPRSREHRKRERRERRGGRSDRSHRTGTTGSSSTSNHPQGSLSSSSTPHHRSQGHSASSATSGYYGTTGRHHNHHHHHRHHRSGGGGSGGPISSNSFNSGSSAIVQQPSSNFSASVYGGGNEPSTPASSQDQQCIISEVQSTAGGDDRMSSGVISPVPTELATLGPPPGSPVAGMPDLLDSHLPPAPPPYSTLPHHPNHHHHHLPPPPPPSTLGMQPHPPPPQLTAPVPIPLLSSPVPMSLMPAHPPTLISPTNCLPGQPVRYHFTTAAAAPSAAGARASRRSMRAHRGVPYASEEEPKTCCGMSASQAVSIRWFIIVIAVIGICCTLAGTALGAARSAGKEHLTLSLLMIGVGVLLLTVSGVAWRLTANESGSSCRAMLGFARSGSSRGDGGSEPNRRFVPRLPPSYGRPHHPYAAMMYPEFQYRAPPPSYQASMQEYRLRLLLLERSNPTIAALGSQAMGHGPVTMVPPPPYRPYSANMRMLPQARLEDYSRPPSYRSRSSGGNGTNGDYGPDGISGSGRPSMDPSVGHNHHHHLSHHHHHNHPHHHHAHIIESPMHSRDPSLLSYLSQQSVDNMSVVSGHNPATSHTATVVTVVQAVSVGMDIGLGSTLGPPYDVEDEDGKGLPSLEDDKSMGYDVVGGDQDGHQGKDGNLVRIVQTTDSSQVIGRESVIVTVSSGDGRSNGGSLWDSYHLGGPTTYAAITNGPVSPQNNNHSNNNNNSQTSNSQTCSSTSSSPNDRDQQGGGGGNSSSSGGTSEVQILAHL